MDVLRGSNPSRPLPNLSLPLTADRRAIVAALKAMLAEGLQIYDTETVGLANPEICELALVHLDSSGITPLLNERICTVATEWEPGAIQTHGITPEMVVGCRNFPDVWLDMLKHTSQTNHLFSYNQEFDLKAIRASARAHGFNIAFPASHSRPGTKVWTTGAGLRCAMKMYSLWVGEYKIKKNGEPYQDATFQKLPDYGHEAHSALGDCLSTANLIQDLARIEL